MIHVAQIQGYASLEDLRSPALASRIKGYYYVD
jgi:hypothetical protein